MNVTGYQHAEDREEAAAGVSRRRLLGGTGLVGLGIAVGAAGVVGVRAAAEAGTDAYRFFGAHQPGIAEPATAHLIFTAFDMVAAAQSVVRTRLRDLLRAWSAAAATLMAGRPADGRDLATGLGPARLSVTIGLGASVLRKAGLDDAVPAALAPIPAFGGEKLDPLRCDGDLALQVCADDPVVAFAAVRSLSTTAFAHATLPRWTQRGFLRSGAAAQEAGSTPRNLMGQVDGTSNPVPGDGHFEQAVWAADPAWMRGGSYLVCRRIRMLLDHWDRQTLQDQERVIGRFKATGAPLSGGSERTAPDFTLIDSTDQPVIPVNAHIRLAHPDFNDGARMLRRGYSYDNGLDADGGANAGLFFQAFQADPRRAFVQVQRKLDLYDPLAGFVQHETNALFAIPPGAEPDGYVAQRLFGE